jgi:hypothetical protein
MEGERKEAKGDKRSIAWKCWVHPEFGWRTQSALPRVQLEYLSLLWWRWRRWWRIRRLPNRTITASYPIHRYEVPANFHSYVTYYFPYFSNSCTSFLRGVTLHLCHLGYGPWCTIFLEGDHDRPGQRYEQRKGRGRQHNLSPVDNSSSHNTGSSMSYSYVFDIYMAPDPSQMIQDVQWVYEWENPNFYNMLV